MTSAGARLDAWKEIAAYLRRDIKTVQRWERRHGLPVHRLQHDKPGSVYAYRTELDAWMAGRDRVHATELDASEADTPAPLQDAGDDRFGALPEHSHAEGGSPVTLPTAKGPSWIWVSAAGVMVAAGLAAVIVGPRLSQPSATAPAGATPVRFQVGPPLNAAFAGTLVNPDPEVSPDGRLIVFRAAERDSGRQRLYLRALDRPDAEALEGTDDSRLPFWSPDSRHVGFFAGGELKQVALDTRRVTSLARAPGPGGGAWLASGHIVFNPDAGEGLLRLSLADGRSERISVVEAGQGQLRHIAPVVAEDGVSVLYLAEHDEPARNSLWVVTPGEGSASRIGPLRRMGRPAPGGWFVYFLGSQLVAQRLDVRKRALGGAAVELGDILDRDDATSLYAGLSISTTGVLAYWPVTRSPAARLTWFDRQGHEIGTFGTPGDYPFVSLSPDGGRAALQRVDDTTSAPDLWLHDLAKGIAVRLTAGLGNEENPVWSPTGDELAYARHSTVGGGAEVRRLRPAAPLTDAPLGRRPVAGHPTDWSRDGGRVLVQATRTDSNSDLVAVRLSDGAESVVAGSRFNERHGRLSPDGRDLAYSSDVSGRLEVYVKRLDEGAAVVQVSTGGGSHPRWRADGLELFYLSPMGVVSAVPVVPSPTFTAGPPVPLFDARPPLPLVFLDTLYDVSPDGQRFLVAAAERPAITAFTVVTHALGRLR